MVTHKGVLPLVTALVATAGVILPSAHAASYFFDEASFQSASGGGLSFESFEALTATNIRSDRNSVVVPGFTLTSPNGDELSIFDMDDGGSHATHGLNYVLWGDFVDPDTPTPNDEVVFNFNASIDAFSLMLSDALDLSVSGASIGFTNNLSESTTIATAPTGDAEEIFFGVISPGMTSISITTSSNYFAGDRIGIDAISFGNIPEPALLAHLGGVAVLALRRRHRLNRSEIKVEK